MHIIMRNIIYNAYLLFKISASKTTRTSFINKNIIVNICNLVSVKLKIIFS